MLEMKNVVKTFDAFRALDQLTLTASKGSRPSVTSSLKLRASKTIFDWSLSLLASSSSSSTRERIW